MRTGVLAIPFAGLRAERRLVGGLGAAAVALLAAILLGVGSAGLALYWLLGLGFGVTF